jgi:transposase
MQIPKGYILLTEEDYLELFQQIMKMEQRIRELESMNKKDSSNSHKPPSSDGLKKKIQNNREKSDRKQGAQEGHEGKTLQMVANPDKTVFHKVAGHCTCGKDLKRIKAIHVQRRQEIDLVEKLTEIIEHQIEVKQCSCGKIHTGEEGRLIPIQYGERLKSMMVYLNQYGFMPYDRLQEYFNDCFGLTISDGVLVGANKRCSENLEVPDNEIKEQVKASPVMNNDETGLRCEKKTQWVHTSSTEEYTYYSLHEKRGREAIDDIGILPGYTGTSVHDRYSSYNDYDCNHALCNAHLLRDLKSIVEDDNKQWAKRMISFLIKAKEMKEAGEIRKKPLKYLLHEYDLIVKYGMRKEPPLIIPLKRKRGRLKKPKSLLLLEDFQKKKEQVLKFILNPIVPFDNNLAERDLRMIKLKQKISGCFRTKIGAQMFCRIRSYISTVRKQGYSILEALQLAMAGNPIRFSLQ